HHETTLRREPDLQLLVDRPLETGRGRNQEQRQHPRLRRAPHVEASVPAVPGRSAAHLTRILRRGAVPGATCRVVPLVSRLSARLERAWVPCLGHHVCPIIC